MRDNIRKLRAQIAEKRQALEALHTAAEAEDRDLTPEELETWDATEGEVKSLNARLERTETVEREKAAAATPVGDTPRLEVGDDNRENEPWGPTPERSFAAFMQAVHRATPQVAGVVDPRLHSLRQAAPSGSNEGIGSEGGFALDPAVSTMIEGLMFDSAELLGRCMDVPVGEGRNHATITMIDETSRVVGSRFGGVQVYHAAEAGTVTAKKPKIRKVDAKLEKIMGLWYCTDEELEDSAYMAALGPKAFGEEIAFQVDEDIFAGSGAGMALGILNAPCLVTQAKETGQEAASLYAANISNMWARMPARSRANSVWLINPDVEPALDELTVGDIPGGHALYVPPGGIADAPYGRLKGRPVIPNEHSKTLGTVGDIALADFGWYAAIRKSQSIESAVSIHVRFVYDETAFRFVYRFNGLPVLSAPMTPAQGSNTVSPFVALATRA